MNKEEALKQIRQWSLPRETREVLEALIPELRESEDEKFRKYILQVCKECVEADDKGLELSMSTTKKLLVYLEKQKDILSERASNITANMLEDGIEGIQRELIEFLSNTINASWVDIIKSADAYAQRIRSMVEKQKEQKPKIIIPKFRIGEYIKPKPYNEKHLIKSINEKGYVLDVDFVVPFKDEDVWEVVEQKQEWSEDDKRIMNEIITIMDGGEVTSGTYLSEYVAWLKSLRLSWKPSKEQMKQLHYALTPGSAFDCDILNELYEQLKKLM